MSHEGKFEHLGFSKWPFHSVPDQESSHLWFDMQETQKQFRKMARSIEMSSSSSINPVWGWFGMGKTHLLMHLQGSWNKDDSEIIPIRHEFPVDPTSFLDLYRAFVESFFVDSSQLLRDMVKHSMDKHGFASFTRTICPTLKDFAIAMRLLLFGQSESVVDEWVRGERVHLNILKSIGLSNRIETDEKAVSSLCALVKLVTDYPKKQKIVWLIDEFQMILKLRPNHRNSIQNGLLALFSRSPKGLSIIPAYSGRMPEKLDHMLPGALLSRMGVSQRVSITPLSIDDAKIFIRELLDAHRPEGYAGECYFPFSEDSIGIILKTIADETWELKPRNVMSVLQNIVYEYEMDLADKSISLIDIDEASRAIDVIKKSPEMISGLTRLE